ncbi:MAG: hypothetical protein Q9171_000152 [Xanthocarpia ochracea]
MGSHPRPHWFLVRPDNTITPLIAVDELPPSIHIAGVPAAMSLADTKSMESVGVRGRSSGTYDAEAREILSEPLSSTLVQPPVDKTNYEEAPKTTETKPCRVQDEEASNVEKWRQDVENPDETQARIDAVVAANGLVPEEDRPTSKDENPRNDRAKAGLVPGKKVYCSHWIRKGDCDFVQQGCLYKHEMPDDDTLRAIGIRALPSWYIAAHPEKARERGWGSGNRAGGPSSRTWKPATTSFPAPSISSLRLPLQAHLPSFQPPGRSAKVGSPFSQPQVSYPHTFTQVPITSRPDQQFGFPRVQELSDHQYQQWQKGTLDRPSGLQIVRKPLRSPGYKTFPFQLPAPLHASASGTSHTEPKTLWPARQSKFSKASEEHSDPIHGQEGGETSGPEPAANNAEVEAANHFFSDRSTRVDTYSQLKSNIRAATRSSSLQQNVHHVVIPKASTSHPNVSMNGFAPLEPSTLPEPVSPKLPIRESKPNVSSDLIDLAPTVNQKAPRQMFSRTVGEGKVSGPRNLERKNQTRFTIKQEVKEVQRSEVTTPKGFRQIRAAKELGGKDAGGDNKKKQSCSPEGKPKAKRTVKDGGPPRERLLDYEE